MRRERLTLFVATFLLSVGIAHAQTIRDYYAEPGLNPFKETLGQHFNESINPFSGGLSLSYTDILIPGNGGFDIQINRTYNNVQTNVGAPSANGLGWTMHMGRIIVSSDHVDKMCAQASWATSGIDNPSLELPDGGRETLFLSTYSNVYLITRSRWKAECNGGNGMIVTSPDGTIYTMSQHGFVGYLDGEHYWYTTRVEDRNGNTLNITYNTTGGDAHISTITASDGRTVTFNYQPSGTSVRLASVSAAGQTWNYNYTSIAGLADGYDHLTGVVRPDGTHWGYEYYPGSGAAGEHSLKRVTYPYGAHITYTYGLMDFDPNPSSPSFGTTVVTKKVMGGAGGTGTWNFAYTAGYSFGSALDKTVVTAPNGRYEYLHWGYSGTGNEQQWKVGLLEGKEVFNSLGVKIEQEVNTWDGQAISNENYWHGRNKIDSITRTPILLGRRLWRDGSVNETQYSNHDQYGNPQTKLEIGSFSYDGGVTAVRRTTQSTYFIDASRWILSIPDDETIVDVGTILRSHDSSGNMRSENKFGVLTSYTYTGQGDIATQTDARNKVTTYDNYYRGVAQLETHPGNVVITRVVNPSGTVASETNGRGITKSFTYDSMRRIASIDFPINADVTVTRSTNTQTLVRGSYKRIDVLDGFGRPTQTTHRDTVRNITTVTNMEYDVLGNKTFESNPNSALGTRYTYDVLNRVIRIDNPDETFQTVRFRDPDGSEGRILVVTDERGNITKKLLGAYGDPADTYLIKVVSPENVTTHIPRNEIGQPRYVWQETSDGLTQHSRSYNYNDNKFLTLRTDPEIGTTYYGRDEVGNMISKQIGTRPIVNYVYDDLGRLSVIDYPSGYSSVNDVTYTYDGNNNVRTMQNTFGNRTYNYDDNDNLINESLYAGSRLYTANYTINDLDNIDSLQYPTGRVVSYSPDAFGRSTSALPYINNVEYHPSGQASKIVYANGQIADIEVNDRQWVRRMHTRGAASIVDLNYVYDGVGNVKELNDAIDPSKNLTLGYDGLDRLISASGSWGSGAISYDEFGNITQKAIGGETLSYAYNNMRLAGVWRNGVSTGSMTYDGYGNLASWQDPFDPFIPDFLYFHDPAGDLYTVRRDNQFYRYEYDGDHQLVKSTDNTSKVTYHLYSRGGDLLGDYNPDGTWKNEYIYLGSKQIAQIENTLPVAVATGNTSQFEGQTVSLNGTSSHAYGSTLVAYAWTQVSGPSVTITNANTATATFVAPAVDSSTNLQFRLTVTDDEGLSGTSDVDISIWDAVPPPIVDSISTQQGLGENRLNWSPVPQANSYTIYWSTTPGVTPGTGNAITDITGTDYLHTGLTDGQAYYYLIVGNNQYGEGIDYREVTVTPGMNGWSQPYRLDQVPPPVADKPILDLKIVDHPSGRKLAVWVQDLSPGYNNLKRYIYASWYDNTTGWTAPEIVSGDLESSQYGNSFEIVVHKHTGKVVVAWVFGGFHVVKYDPVTGWGQPYSSATTFTVDNFRLTVGQGGHLYASWIKPGSQGILRAYVTQSHIDSVQWTAPYEIAYSHAIKSLTADTNGNAIILYQSGNSYYFWRYDVNSAQWAPLNNPSYTHNWLYQNMVSNSRGELLLSGLSYNGSNPAIIRYIPGSGWTSPIIAQTQSAVGTNYLFDNGDALILWIEQDPSTSVYVWHAAVNKLTTGWEPQSIVGVYGCCARLSGSSNGGAVLTWSISSPTGETTYASQYTATTGWKGPYKLTENIGSINNLVVDASGNATMVWASVDPVNGGLFALHYNHLGDTQPYPNAPPTCGVYPAYTRNNSSLHEGQTFSVAAHAQDSDGVITGYSWTQTLGTPLDIGGDTTNIATITIPQIASGSEDFDFVVTANDDAGNTCKSGFGISVYRTSAPYGLQLTPGDGSINLSWNNVSNAASYNIYWSTTPGVTIEASNKIEGLTQTSYTHNDLTNETVYYYAISLINQYGVESLLSAERSARVVREIWSPQESISATGSSSKYPQLSMATNGNAFVAWEDEAAANTIWGNRYIVGTGWQTPERINLLPPEINAQTARYPETAINDAGDVVVVWEQYDYDADVTRIWVRRYIGGQGWQPAELLETSAYDAGNPQVAIGNDGRIIAVWYQSDVDGNMSVYARRYIPASGWSTEELIEVNPTEAHWSEFPQIAIDGLGNYIATWDRWDDIHPSIWSRRYEESTGWQSAQQVSTPSTSEDDGSFKPAIATDGGGNAIVTWLEWDGPILSIMAARYSINGGWSVPELLETSDDVTFYSWDQERPVHIDMNTSGQAIVSWKQRNQSNINVYDLYTNMYDPGLQGWTGSQRVSELTEGQVSSGNRMHPRVGMSDNGRAIVAWVGQWSGDYSSRVFANYYEPSTGWGSQRLVSTVSPVYFGLDADIDQNGNALIVWAGDYTNPYTWASSLDAANVASPNTAPTANAGVDQIANEGSLVTLNGSSSTDAEGPVTFAWLQTSGPAVTLDSATTAMTNFMAPNVTVDTPLSFDLTVTDSGGLTASDSVTVTVQMLDSDGDGMSDLWEQQHFGSTSVLATGDADGDDVSNLDEFNQGTNPLEGDVNADGALNVADILLAQRHVLGLSLLNSSQEAALDLVPAGGNGVVDVADLLILQKRVLRAR